MKIMGKNPLIHLDAYAKNVTKTEEIVNNDAQKSEGVAKGDKVILSPKAKAIQEAKKLLENVPDIREEKVARIKEQIKNGTYTVDAKKVAARMVEESVLNDIS